MAPPPLGGGRRRARRGRRRAATSRSSTTRSSPPTARRSPAAARARSSSTSLITARTRGPSAPRPSAGWPAPSPPDGLRLALTGTPVLNHADELIAQLRVIGRLGGLRVRRALLPTVPRPAQRGAAALASASPLLRTAAEVRGAAAAARQAPGRGAGRADQRARIPAGRARRDRVAAHAAARPVRARRADRRDAARRAARPARDAAAAGRPGQARGRRWPGSTTSWPPASRWSCSPVTSRSSRPCSSASPMRCTCSAATRSPIAKRRSPLSRTPTVRS